MDQRFPRGISAVRVASFISTAAWIQGTSAEDVALPPEALDNFLRRHGIRTKKARQATPPPEEEEDEPEEDEPEEDEPEDEEEDEPSSVSSGDTGSQTGVSSATGSSGASTLGGADGVELPEGATAGNQAAIEENPSGPSLIGPGPKLSPGALAATIVWSIIGAVAIAGLAFFFIRRRQRARAGQQDEEGRSDQPMAMQGAAPSVTEPLHLRPGSQGSARSLIEPANLRRVSDGAASSRAPVPASMEPSYMPPGPSDAPLDPSAMEPAYLPPEGRARSPSVAPSGRWLPVPPWQEEPATWRESRPWRQSSQPSIVPVGLPANPSPRAMGRGATMSVRQSQVDRRTKYTDDTESTIFAYR